LAIALEGELLIPNADNFTPQSAVVKVTIDGHEILIDFLSHVLGIQDAKLKKSAINLLVQVRTPAGDEQLKIPIMHPLHCFQSRVANIIYLQRRDDTAKRQLEASPIILREFISEMLANGQIDHATETLQHLHKYLLADIYGKKAHGVMKNDPLKTLQYFLQDKRIDKRFREMTLVSFCKQISQKRSVWTRMVSLIGLR
jgi:hypothetical protein